MRDDELLDAYRQRGSGEAMTDLFRRYSKRVYNFSLSILRDPARAEDVTHQVFLRVLQSETAPSPNRFRGWIYRIAYREALQAMRSESRREQREHRAVPQGTSSAPEEELMQREMQGLVRQALEGLDTDHQVPLRLRYQHGLTFAEIAETLGEPQGTIARRVHEAKERLKKRLEITACGMSPALGEEFLEGSLPMEPVPHRLTQRLDRITPRISPLPRGATTPGLATLLSKSGVVTAVTIPVLALGLAWGLRSGNLPEIQTERDTPPMHEPLDLASGEGSELPAGHAGNGEGTTEAHPPTPLADAGATGQTPPASTEAVFHVSFDGATGPEVVPVFRAAMNLESLEARFLHPTHQETTRDGPGRYTVRIPCTVRTLFEIEGHPVRSGAEGIMIGTLEWVVGGPGEVVDVRVAPPEGSGGLHEIKTPERVLLEELQRTTAFGAIRGRLLEPALVEIAGDALGTDDPIAGLAGLARGTDRSYRQDDGFLLIPVRPGNHTLRIRGTSPGSSGTSVVEADVRAGLVADLGAISPAAGTTFLGGFVTDESGAPVAGARVMLVEGDPFADASSRHMTTRTDASGAFRFDGLDARFRDPRVTVMPDYRIPRRNVPAELGREDLSIRLPGQARIYLTGVPAGDTGPGVGLEPLIRATEGEDQLTELWDSDRPDVRFLMTVNVERIPLGTPVRLRRAGERGHPDLVGEWFELQDGAVVEVRLTELQREEE